MRAELTPEHLPGYMTIELSAVESHVVSRGEGIAQHANPFNPNGLLNVQDLKFYSGADKEDVVEDRRAIAQVFTGGDVTLYVPDLDRSYYTRVPIPPNRVYGETDRAALLEFRTQLPPRGIMLIFDRALQESAYDLFPKPKPEEVK